MATLPNGLTSLEPIPYGERRWNGAIWAHAQVDSYNRELCRIKARHEAGMNTQHLIDGLYNLADSFDFAGKPRKQCDATLAGVTTVCSDDSMEVWHGMATPAVACGKHVSSDQQAVFNGHRVRVASEQH